MEKLRSEIPVNLKKQAYDLCRDYLAGPWTDIQLSDFNISIVRGGLSNKLYLCSLPETNETKNDKVPRRVLLRLYGSLQESIEQISTELVTFVLLSERGLGPRLYGCFPKGRLEEYIQSRCLESSELSRFSTSIAKEVAKIHSVQVPVKKTPDMVENYIKKWISEIKILENERQLSLSKFDFVVELNWLKNEIKKLKLNQSSIVYCHNDILAGNILLREDLADPTYPKLMLIDYEFASYNYRSFDFANHFCEWCFHYNTKHYPHFVANLNLFPIREQQVEFLKSYLDQMKNEGHVSSYPTIEAEIETILDEIMVFRLQSHLLWSIWGYKSSLEGITVSTFGYEEYSKERFRAYQIQKEELLKHRGLIDGTGDRNRETI